MLTQMGCAEGVLTVLGLVVAARWVVYLVLDVVAAFRIFVWARLWNDNLALKYGGKWAVVTGCTDGIGKEYARQLAGRGMNILLISRNIDKLNNVQKLIKEASPDVETETVQVDFSHGRVVYPEIARHLTGKDIGILVNNVGVTLIPQKKFIDVSEDEIWSQVNVNVASVVAMTQLVLTKMMARGSGAIINVASIFSTSPVPYWGIYSATKVFVDFFSESLSWECRGSGVTVQTLRPGAVFTNMATHIKGMSKPGPWFPTTSVYVSSALPTLGHTTRTTGYWRHGVQNFMTDKIMNRNLVMYGVEKIFKPSQEGMKQE